MTILWNNFIELFTAAAPWLLVGLFVTGLLKAWIPSDLLSKHLGKQGLSSIFKAAFIGAPLPLCSCGVIPAALGIRQSGASKSATVSFLVATPETGVDSIAISYALLGPLMAIVRPIAAISSAITAGILTLFIETRGQHSENEPLEYPLAPDTKINENKVSTERKSTCCNKQKTAGKPNYFKKTTDGLHFSFTKILDDIVKWLLIGIVFATLVKSFIDPSTLTTFGSGLPAMIVMVLIGIPMYICATASTPIAAGLILSGISPGTVLVFLLAGPATNMATLGMVKQSMGLNTLLAYLAGVVLCSIGFGLGLDFMISYYDINISAHIEHHKHILPGWVTNLSVVILSLLIANSLIKTCRKKG